MTQFPSKEAVVIYDYFKTLPGSKHIGKPVSLDAIIGICKNFNPKRVLEMGGGIGAISYTILKSSSAFVDIYEDNEFCINQLKINLKEFAGRFQIIETYQTLPPEKEYDLVIIDGGTGREGDGGYASAAHLFLLSLNRVNTVYIEGYRGMQRDSARMTLRAKYVCKFKVYNEVYSEGRKWPGGLEITCQRTSSALLRWASFIFWQMIIEVRRIYFYIRSFLKGLKRA